MKATIRRPLFFPLMLCLTVLLWLSPLSAQIMQPFTMSDIRLEGLQRITPGTVFNYMPIEVGDQIDRESASNAMRALFRTGFFEDIVFEQQGDILVITFVERPAISAINLDGNKAIKEDDLLSGLANIGLAEGEVFDRMQLDRVTQELTRQYYARGKYNVKLDADVVRLDRNRVEIDIAIDEGDTARIQHFNIVGNEAFDDETLFDEFELSTGNLLSFYTNDDQYSREKLSGDLEVLRSFYMDRGYVDFDVESTQVSISPDKQDIYITANIREGQVFTISEIQIAGELMIGEETIRALIPIQAGDVFSRKALEQGADNITAVLGNLGYAFANVTPAPEIDRDNKTVKVLYFVDPGKRVYVRRIVFKGNLKTKDEVLRREMRQFEGGWFSQIAIERSRIRLQRLGFFDNVQIESPPVAGTDDQVDVIVSVEERTAGSFSFGLGYSQTAGIIGSLSVTQDNFLGTGKRITFNLQNSTIVSRFDVAYQNPYWTDDGVSRGFAFSYRELDQGQANIARYTSNVVSLSANFGIPVTETDRINLLVGVDFNEIATLSVQDPSILDQLSCQIIETPIDPDDPDSEVITSYQCPKQTFETYRAEASWSRDSRNHFFIPSYGSLQQAVAEVALPGSTDEFYKLFYRNTKYFPLTKNLTFSLGGEVGYGDGYGNNSQLPFFENFFAGGVTSIRGFDDNTLGPRECRFSAQDVADEIPEFTEWLATGNCPTSRVGNPIGGAFKLVGSAEVIFPVPFIKDKTTSRMAWFLDAGNVYKDIDSFEADEIRYTTGISLQWQAPVGPIIINFAYPLNDKDFDETETVQFSFGNTF